MRNIIDKKSAVNLKTNIDAILSQWELDKKLFGTVTDSGRNIYAAVKMYPPHVEKLLCAAHRMNAVMKDIFVETEIKIKNNKDGEITYHCKEFDEDLGGFYTTEISSARVQEITNLNEAIGQTNYRLDACRHLVGSFNHNCELKRALVNQQLLLNYQSRIKLKAEANTRYSYIYTMINSICCNQQALEIIGADDSLNMAIKEYVPSKIDLY